MPSISIPPITVPITGATTLGVITFSAADLFPGSWGWMAKNDGSDQVKVKVLSVSPNTSAATSATVRVYPNNSDEQGQGNWLSAGYGYSDVSAFNTASSLWIGRQSVPIDPAYSKRDLAPS